MRPHIVSNLERPPQLCFTKWRYTQPELDLTSRRKTVNMTSMMISCAAIASGSRIFCQRRRPALSCQDVPSAILVQNSNSILRSKDRPVCYRCLPPSPDGLLRVTVPTPTVAILLSDVFEYLPVRTVTNRINTKLHAPQWRSRKCSPESQNGIARLRSCGAIMEYLIQD